MVGTPTWNLWQQGLVLGGIFLKLKAAAWTLCLPPLMCTLQGLIRDLWGVGGGPFTKGRRGCGPSFLAGQPWQEAPAPRG